MKAVVAAFNQEKALVGAFSVITNLRMELFQALVTTDHKTLVVELVDDVPVAVLRGVDCPGHGGHRVVEAHVAEPLQMWHSVLSIMAGICAAK